MKEKACMRHDGRLYDQFRSLHVSYGWSSHAAGSVMLQLGRTKVLASVMMQPGVPSFLRGKGSGWITAEYALLPASTVQRIPREISLLKRAARSVEISRLIGRSLRAVANMDVLGERTLHIDCDVLEADGSTRVAAIMAASLALHHAERRWLETRFISTPFMRSGVLACSVGIARNGNVLLDLDYVEDSAIAMDGTVVMTTDGAVIEMHCAGEGAPFSWDQLTAMHAMVHQGFPVLRSWYEGARQQNVVVSTCRATQFTL